jgi:hypothetical protein
VEIDLNTRLTLAFILAITGLVWQGVIVTTGGEASEALITAFSTILLATIGIGIKTGNGNGNGKSNS